MINLSELIGYLSFIHQSMGDMPVFIGKCYKETKDLESIFVEQKRLDPDSTSYTLNLTSTNVILNDPNGCRNSELKNSDDVVIQPVYTFSQDQKGEAYEILRR